MPLRLISFLLALFLVCAPAFADDWTVIKLRGTVEQLIDTTWTALARGDVVPDDRTVRTGPDGHVDLQRGKEVVTLGASTQVQIHDKTDARFTTVQQDFGSVEVEAEVENAPHFVVDTQFLAAVVKGTHFVVTSSQLGASVTVDRGFVAVQSKASKRSTTVTVGQTASVAPVSDIVLSGTGTLPAVFGPDGTQVVAAGSPSGAVHFSDDGSAGSGSAAATPIKPLPGQRWGERPDRDAGQPGQCQLDRAAARLARQHRARRRPRHASAGDGREGRSDAAGRAGRRRTDRRHDRRAGAPVPPLLGLTGPL